MSSKTTSYDSYSCTMFKCFNRKFKINEAVPSTDIKGTFSIFAEGGDLMTTNQFRRFLVEHQGHVDLTSSNAEQIIREVIQRRNCDAQDKKIRPGLNLDEFFSFLFSDFNFHFQSEVRYFHSIYNFFFFFVFQTCAFHVFNTIHRLKKPLFSPKWVPSTKSRTKF